MEKKYKKEKGRLNSQKTPSPSTTSKIVLNSLYPLPPLCRRHICMVPLHTLINRIQESELNRREEKAANNGKKQQTAKAHPRASNIQNQNSNKKIKNTSKSGFGKSRDNEKKQISDKGDQKRKVYILGDSLVKGIKNWKMQSKDTKVVVRSFAAAKIRQMQSYAKPAEEDNPSLYILHVGTNDLKENKSAMEVADEITSLARSLKKGYNEVTISGNCPRGDHLNATAVDVNGFLEKRCKQYQTGFIKHVQIDATLHTNGSNLHLNQVEIRF